MNIGGTYMYADGMPSGCAILNTIQPVEQWIDEGYDAANASKYPHTHLTRAKAS
jgi:hypothetical protein